jgi:hypothetical protein
MGTTRRITRTIVTTIDYDHNHNTTHEMLLESPDMDTKLRDREDLVLSTSLTV